MVHRQKNGGSMMLQAGVEDLFKKCEISVVE
jgi:hypothetical protein